jgi:choline dehydrogenase-like flavoprotein
MQQQELMSQHYDVVIVGSGPAGLVLAKRLSENVSKRILVIEAGLDRRGDPRIDTPGMLFACWSSPELDWGLSTVPQVGITVSGIANAVSLKMYPART